METYMAGLKIGEIAPSWRLLVQFREICYQMGAKGLNLPAFHGFG
jgi:hypothetical protein